MSRSGCFATLSVINATTKADAPADAQKDVFIRLESLLSCL